MTPLLVVALIVGAPGLKDPPKAAPVLVGHWRVESSSTGGTAGVPSAGTTIEFADEGQVVVQEDESRATGTYKLNARPDPPHIDLAVVLGIHSNAAGILKLEGDTLTLCLGPEVDRPTAFDSEPGSFHALIKLKRITKD
jgi:uncharacterized protein (TIGR03067 family)